MLRDRVKGKGGQDLCGGNAPASTPRLPHGLHWLCGAEDLPRLTPGLLLSKTKHLTSYLKWPPHVPPPGSHLSCCHDSGLAHGTRSHVLGNVSYLGRVRPSLWSRAELSWAGTKWQNCIHSDVQKHRPLSSMTHLILLLHLYSHRCLGKEWGRSFNSSIKDSSAFSCLKVSFSLTQHLLDKYSVFQNSSSQDPLLFHYVFILLPSCKDGSQLQGVAGTSHGGTGKGIRNPCCPLCSHWSQTV